MLLGVGRKGNACAFRIQFKDYTVNQFGVVRDTHMVLRRGASTQKIALLILDFSSSLSLS